MRPERVALALALVALGFAACANCASRTPAPKDAAPCVVSAGDASVTVPSNPGF